MTAAAVERILSPAALDELIAAPTARSDLSVLRGTHGDRGRLFVGATRHSHARGAAQSTDRVGWRRRTPRGIRCHGRRRRRTRVAGAAVEANPQASVTLVQLLRLGDTSRRSTRSWPSRSRTRRCRAGPRRAAGRDPVRHRRPPRLRRVGRGREGLAGGPAEAGAAELLGRDARRGAGVVPGLADGRRAWRWAAGVTCRSGRILKVPASERGHSLEVPFGYLIAAKSASAWAIRTAAACIEEMRDAWSEVVIWPIDRNCRARPEAPVRAGS